MPRAAIFPLLARRPIAGLSFGRMRSTRRGPGWDLAGSRPYRPGDDLRRIDRRASARLSSAWGSDELFVREHQTEEAVHVLVAVDPAPTMALCPATLPWLPKPAVVAGASRLIAESAAEARCPLAERPATLAGLSALAREIPAGSFVFLLSDFLAFPDESAWRAARMRRWDLVPVVVQDPLWEQSFPDVAGVVLPLADAEGARARLVRLTRQEAHERRLANEARLRRILGRFEAMGLDWIVLSREDPGAILEAFLAWTAGRRVDARRVR